jgi:phosphoketolase
MKTSTVTPELLPLPAMDFRDYAEAVPAPRVGGIGDEHVLGRFPRDVAKLNSKQRNFRVFDPDETLSNGLEALFEVTERQWDAATVPRPSSTVSLLQIEVPE